MYTVCIGHEMYIIILLLFHMGHIVYITDCSTFCQIYTYICAGQYVSGRSSFLQFGQVLSKL